MNNLSVLCEQNVNLSTPRLRVLRFCVCKYYYVRQAGFRPVETRKHTPERAQQTRMSAPPCLDLAPAEPFRVPAVLSEKFFVQAK